MRRASSMMWNSGCAKKRGMAERSVGDGVDSPEAVQGGESASTAGTGESIDEATFLSPPGRLRRTRGYWREPPWSAGGRGMMARHGGNHHRRRSVGRLALRHAYSVLALLGGRRVHPLMLVISAVFVWYFVHGVVG
jgi:hypothetical protein